MENRRRALLAFPGLMTVPLAACSGEGGEDVGAVEDLMREHGILRRSILVFRECAARLSGAGQVDARALHRTAQLFRDFGENYHEKKLEEENIFPQLRKAGGDAANMVQALIDQHNRGREIIDYVLATSGGAIVQGQDLVAPLNAFELMYANHAAREDTIIFPAWKKAIGGHAVEEMGEKFEDIEKKQFGGDGFDMAVKTIGEIEQTLGLSNIAQFTAPPPPHH
ncbi:MAG TPA: hemerythrin domain-containing protein [Rhizomicrobium sp.]|nr:hemerythrin domain-containing protein [Rhizomicrobium sp.]